MQECKNGCCGGACKFDPQAAKVSSIINKYAGDKLQAIRCLQEVQDELGYLPESAVAEIAEVLGVAESDLFSIITFYAQFNLRKKAKYTIEICLGTACYVLGADKVLKQLEEKYNIKLGQQSSDGLVEIVQSRCLGCCGLAPVIKINGELHGKLTAEKTNELIKGLV